MFMGVNRKEREEEMSIKKEGREEVNKESNVSGSKLRFFFF